MPQSTVTERTTLVDTGSSPYASNSVEYTNGNLALTNFGVWIASGTEPSAPTLTGNGQTWNAEAGGLHSDLATATWYLRGFSAHLASQSAGVQSATVSATDGTDGVFKGVEITEVPASAAVLQAVYAEGGASLTPGATLTAFPDTVNDVCYFAVFAYRAAGAPTVTMDGSLIKLGTDLNIGSTVVMSHGYMIGEDQTPSATLSLSSFWSCIAYTIDSTGAAATGRIMGSLAGPGGLAAPGGLAGMGGGLAGFSRVGNLFRPNHKLFRPRLVPALQGA